MFNIALVHSVRRRYGTESTNGNEGVLFVMSMKHEARGIVVPSIGSIADRIVDDGVYYLLHASTLCLLKNTNTNTSLSMFFFFLLF